jgi:phosphopantothenoylcysteine decarboxylase/phosphopantothenate--cysteine ligase
MKICLGVTGSIAAYRSPDLVKALIASGHELRVLPTARALEFVTARSLETFSGQAVLSNDAFASDHLGTDHIAVARWADVVLVYGATATFLARYAMGLAEDFLTLQLLATRAPVIVAPAMNPAMWEHAAVQSNVALLRSRGVRFVGPVDGVVACGESGTGHVASIEELIAAIETIPAPSPLAGLEQKKLLVSAGPMRSELDPARRLQNRSSGKMGLEIAKAAQRAGARVQVLLGPVESHVREAFGDFEVFPYESAKDYETQLNKLFPSCDVFFSAAAVLDFEFVSRSQKIEREALSTGELTLPIRAVPDFVARCAQNKRRDQKVIAFAAETSNDTEALLKRAREKLVKKGADAVVANRISTASGPESETNEIWLLREKAQTLHLGPARKEDLSLPLLQALFA